MQVVIDMSVQNRQHPSASRRRSASGGSAGFEVAVIAIGRNEGARLIACLDSLAGKFDRIVYVDSGSTDGSVEAAKARGADVVKLDMSLPFSAARARNAGVARLAERGLPDLVQFIDGDCLLAPSWIAKATETLAEHPEIGIMTGWRAEVSPDASIYAQMAEHEWHRPAGDIETCGGDMLVRQEVLEATGGFRDDVIAAEDDEFCIRARQNGWRIHRLPVPITFHNLGMTSFAQWWKRAERAGHGYAQVGHLHQGYFQAQRWRVYFYGFALPVIFIAALVVDVPFVAAVVACIYAVSWLRTARGLSNDALDVGTAAQYALFLSISKFPAIVGLARYHWRRLTGKNVQLIEYK